MTEWFGSPSEGFPVCSECGALIRPGAMTRHQEWHDGLREARDMAWRALTELGADDQ